MPSLDKIRLICYTKNSIFRLFEGEYQMRQNHKIKIAIVLLLIAAAMLILTCCVSPAAGYDAETYDAYGGRETLFPAPETEAATKPVTTAPSQTTDTEPETTEPAETDPPVTDAVTTKPVTQAPSGPAETVYGGFSGLY